MPGNAIKIGPFLGGLNNMSTAGEARDNELTELVNMEVAKDQSLTMRAPMALIPGATRYVSAGNAGLHWDMLGIYRVTENEWYLIAQRGISATTIEVRAYANGDVTTDGTLIKSITGTANRITGMAQFSDYLYFLVGPGSSSPCFRWKRDTTAADITTMPKGNILLSWKSRLWVSGTLNATNGDRVWFSTVDAEGPKPNTWATNDYFNVAPGEGGFVTALIASFNNLIVFKSDGTWRFSYPSSPKQGTIDKISGQVGAATSTSVVEFENFIYVYDNGAVYELVNSNFSRINTFVQFKEDPQAVDGYAPGVDLSIVNRRLFVRYFNALYVFSIDTKAWSLWRSYAGVPGRWIELPANSLSSSASTYMAGAKGETQAPTALIKDKRASGSVTLPASEEFIVFNNTANNDPEVFDIPGTPSSRITLKATAEEIQPGAKIQLTFMLSTGGIAVSSYDLALGANSWDIVHHNSGIVLNVRLVHTPGSGPTRVSNIELNRPVGPSAYGVMRFNDVYSESDIPEEYIEASLLTKTYDYQAATSFKRLFYWGADLVTPEPIHAEARPVGKRNKITWGDLERYTHAELEQGTWGNPLSWLTRSSAVVSMTDANVDISENGRFYVKLAKNLRFRQIAFYLRLTSLGNKATGPAKVFALTTLVNPKKDTIDTAS